MATTSKRVAELRALIGEVDDRIRDLDRLMTTTPTDTMVYAAMAESRPGLIGFRHRLDDQLAAMGV